MDGGPATPKIVYLVYSTVTVGLLGFDKNGNMKYKRDVWVN